MTWSPDRLTHADALRRRNRSTRSARFMRQAGIVAASIATGAFATPYVLLDQPTNEAAALYAVAVEAVVF